MATYNITDLATEQCLCP